MQNEDLTPAEQTLCHRYVTIISGAVRAGLKQHGVPLDEERMAETSKAIAQMTIAYIGEIRTLEQGVPCGLQDKWIQGATIWTLANVWGLDVTEPQPAPRTLN